MWWWILGIGAVVAIATIFVYSRTRRVLFWFLFGHSLKSTTPKNADHDIESLVGLLAIIFGGTVALGASVQETGHVDPWYVIVYGVAGLIPLGGMLHFVHSSTDSFWTTAKAVWYGAATEKTHAYDKATVVFARNCAVASFVFMAFSIALVLAAMFPGQGRSNRVLYPTPVLNLVEPPESVNPRFYFSVPINTTIYKHGIPDDLTPNVLLDGVTLMDWEVYFCRVRDMSRGGLPIPGTRRARRYEAKPGVFGLVLPPLPSDGDLSLDIYLRQRASVTSADATRQAPAPKSENTAEKMKKSLEDELFTEGNLLVIDRPIP